MRGRHWLAGALFAESLVVLFVRAFQTDGTTFQDLTHGDTKTALILLSLIPLSCLAGYVLNCLFIAPFNVLQASVIAKNEIEFHYASRTLDLIGMEYPAKERIEANNKMVQRTNRYKEALITAKNSDEFYLHDPYMSEERKSRHWDNMIERQQEEYDRKKAAMKKE